MMMKKRSMAMAMGAIVQQQPVDELPFQAFQAMAEKLRFALSFG
jgi:hypothetical protein